LKNYNQTQQFGRQCSDMEIFSSKRFFQSLRGLPLRFQRPPTLSIL
jgi:hypothetical protein